MQTRGNLQIATAPVGWTFGQARDQAKRLGARLLQFIDARADAYSAAALYAERSRLSEAELERRGTPRGELPRCTFRA